MTVHTRRINAFFASIRKYAAKSNYVEHTKMPQRLYLRFLCAKRPVARGFRNLPHTSGGRFRKCGETTIGQPDPGFALPRPTVLLPKIELCSEVSDFSPHFRNMRPCKACSSYISGIRDNIQLSWKRQRAVAGKPNNDPSLSPPHVESTATVSLRTSYRNVKRPNKATIGDAVVRLHFPSK